MNFVVISKLNGIATTEKILCHLFLLYTHTVLFEVLMDIRLFMLSKWRNREICWLFIWCMCSIWKILDRIYLHAFLIWESHYNEITCPVFHLFVALCLRCSPTIMYWSIISGRHALHRLAQRIFRGDVPEPLQNRKVEIFSQPSFTLIKELTLHKNKLMVRDKIGF